MVRLELSLEGCDDLGPDATPHLPAHCQLDHLLGRPSASFKRSQVVLVLGFWLAVVVRSPRDGPRALYLRKLSRLLRASSLAQVASPAAILRRRPLLLLLLLLLLRGARRARPDPSLPPLRSDGLTPPASLLWLRAAERFTPWQIVCATLTAVYALRHIADLVGLGCSSPVSLPTQASRVSPPGSRQLTLPPARSVRPLATFSARAALTSLLARLLPRDLGRNRL